MAEDLLAGLEARVDQAVERIHALKSENQELKQKVRELEALLDGEPDEDATAWREERDEIRRRVEELATALEQLLEDAG